MRYDKIQAAARAQALDYISRVIAEEATLPEKVVSGQYRNFLFAESDAVFSERFSDTIRLVMKAEASDIVCIASIDRSPPDNLFPLFEFGILTTGDEYWKVLTKSVNGIPPIAEMGRYVVASEKADWFVYAERINDVALVGIKDTARSDALLAAFYEMPARPLAELLSNGSFPLFPFTHLTDLWAKKLRENYT